MAYRNETSISEIAILMDIYESTNAPKANEYILNITKIWVAHEVPQGVAIAVAHFGSFTGIVIPMTKLSNQSTRMKMADQINTSVAGSSDPIHGLGYLMLQKVFSKKGGLILILTNRCWEQPIMGENEKLTLSEIMQKKVKIVNAVVRMENGNGPPYLLVQQLQCKNETMLVENQWETDDLEKALHEILKMSEDQDATESTGGGSGSGCCGDAQVITIAILISMYALGL